MADSGNQAPLAVDDSYHTYQGRTLEIPAPGILTNDNNPDGVTLSAKLVSAPTSGVITLNPDGSFRYTPNPGFTGRDSFSYKANDGQRDSNVATVTIAVAPASVEPWFEDSFENDPPGAWGPGWLTRALHSLADTTDEVQPPPGDGAYVYREFYPMTPPHKLVTLDYTTSTFTSVGHGFANGAIVSFSLADDYGKQRVVAHTGEILPEGTYQGGAFPKGNGHTVNASANYRIVNATDDTFQVIPGWASGGSPLTFTDNGTNPFYVFHYQHLGGRGMEWGGTSPIPVIGEGQKHDDFSLSYWLKYAEGFDVGTQMLGSKHFRIFNEPNGGGRTFIDHFARGNPPVYDISFTGTSNHQLTANVNGGPLYIDPGEWVKFDWYFKVSSEETGILLGWINNVLRWEYRDIQTLRSGAGNLTGFSWWPQISSDMVPIGDSQERYLDLFRIGPGAMVLSEQGLLP